MVFVKRFRQGFTLVELMIVLTVIAILSGFSFHFGQQAKSQADLLSRKADGLRYQEAFLNYFQTYQRFPKVFPVDRWFNLADYASPFIDILSGQNRSSDNTYGLAFGEFSAEELLTKQITSVCFFLRKHTSLKDAIPSHLKAHEIYGTEVLFYLEH